MPSVYTIDVERGVIFSKGTGVFTYADFLDHMARLLADPRFHPDLHQLTDGRALTSLDVTAEQIRDLALRSIFSVRSRRAFVVGSDLQFGLTRMFAAYREIIGVHEIAVYRDMRDALAWFNLPPDFDAFAAGQPGDNGSIR